MGCAHTTKLLALLDRSLVNRINKYYSPLHCAALSNRPDTALILLDNGARIDLMTNGPEYETPLYLAVKNDAIDCVKLFVERGKLSKLSLLVNLTLVTCRRLHISRR